MFRLNLIFYLFLPLPIYLIASDNGMSLMGFSGIEFYLIVFVVVNAYFMVKILLYKILGSIFSQREKTGELVFNMMLYHNVFGADFITGCNHSFNGRWFWTFCAFYCSRTDNYLLSNVPHQKYLFCYTGRYFNILFDFVPLCP